jgi:archaellum component FlaC
MAEINKRYFLDLEGLTSVWNKIKSTFASKDELSEVDNKFNNVTGEVNGIKSSIETLETNIEQVQSIALSHAPIEVNYYSEAVAASNNLSVGTLINVKSSDLNEDGGESGYLAGIYVVTGAGTIEYLSTTDGDADADSITALTGKVKEIENTYVKGIAIKSGDSTLADLQPTNNVLIVQRDDELDINSDSVNALTHRAVAAKFRDFAGQLSAIPKFKIVVVDELPTREISTSTIYLVKNNSDSYNNLFTEYIYVETTKDNPETTDVNESAYSWEKLGEQIINIDNLVSFTDLNQTLANYVKSSDFNELLNNVKSEILTEVSNKYSTKEDLNNVNTAIDELEASIKGVEDSLESYVTKAELTQSYLSKQEASELYLTEDDLNIKGFATENSILTSIQEGTIGETIAISEEQIENLIK